MWLRSGDALVNNIDGSERAKQVQSLAKLRASRRFSPITKLSVDLLAGGKSAPSRRTACVFPESCLLAAPSEIENVSDLGGTRFHSQMQQLGHKFRSRGATKVLDQIKIIHPYPRTHRIAILSVVPAFMTDQRGCPRQNRPACRDPRQSLHSPCPVI